MAPARTIQKLLPLGDSRGVRVPSAGRVSVALLGRTASAWQEWKYVAGRTLDELKRKVPAP